MLYKIGVEGACDGHMTLTWQSHENSHFSKMELFFLIWSMCVCLCVQKLYIIYKNKFLHLYQMTLRYIEGVCIKK